MSPDFLNLQDRRIAYQRLRGRIDVPGVIFLGGYGSDMTGTKASWLAERCAEAGYPFLRFDYSGCGQSSGEFRKSGIGSWFEDASAVLEALTDGPQIVIGSSMGGWLALMLARQQPERVKALIGIAAAPDFTEDLIWMRLSPEQRAELETQGVMQDPTAPPEAQLPITLHLINEARKHFLLRSKIDIACPTHLLQGLRDMDVPWQHVLRVAEHIAHDDVKVTLIKDGDHRLSRPQDLELLWQSVQRFS
jgi:pimeloyl-ACP methyl ester carboxylesterase